jgi:hypothetical protein
MSATAVRTMEDVAVSSGNRRWMLSDVLVQTLEPQAYRRIDK